MSTIEHRRLLVITLATLVGLAGVVVLVQAALPLIAGWVFPAVLAAATAVLLVRGRMLAAAASPASARLLAGWAGVTSTLALSTGASLASLGGGLVVLLIGVIVVNAGLALWFGSPLHFAAVQWLGLGWAVLAHLAGVAPVAGLVLALAGLWWTGRVGFSRVVVVSTTVLLPVTAALLVHPLTHSGVAVDGADVATVAGFTALALLLAGRVTDVAAPPRLWPTVRTTASVASLAMIVLGGVPAVAVALTPASPWPGLLVGASAVCAAVAVAALSRLRSGAVRALEHAGLLWAVVAVTVVAGPVVGSCAACLAIAAPIVVDLLLRRVAGAAVVVRVAVLLAVGVAAVVVVDPGVVVSVVVLGATAAASCALGLRCLSTEPTIVRPLAAPTTGGVA
ncbi:hypothetical protein AS850_15325 [Frondihabitans sp. 762G35]|uniref:hypothetical protein n=1 Tax=Frondihabitans sp. 762G35 TaxID=1446794 RepID=UPI000D224351|nr:hypothetical protein [Frondihabitans sp. 762G35]ARC58457.1 hypothetical protein AS850_15325 [Frondihabitans sp. 762G35]